MNLCTCLILFRIFAFTNGITRIKTTPKAVEPIEKNIGENFGVIQKNLHNAHSFIARVDNEQVNLQPAFRTSKVETFTDFIQDTVDILNSFNDTAFEDFFEILDTEIRKYHYEGCRFSELMQNHNTRGLLAEALKTVRENSVTFTKVNMNEIADMLRGNMYGDNVKELLNYINYLYRNYKPVFRRVLSNLNNYTKMTSLSHNDLVEIVRDGVRCVLFDAYNELDTYTRRELKEKIEQFWEKNKKNSASNDVENSFVPRYPVKHSVINNVQVFKAINDKIKEFEQAYSSNNKKTVRKKKKIISKTLLRDIDQSENQFKDSMTSEEIVNSGQSLDSSNSIKHSHERYKTLHTQRYKTLFTEEITNKARTTTKEEIIPVTVKLMTRKPNIERQMTKTTPRYRSENVSLDRKKKIKKLTTKYDVHDRIRNMFSQFHDTESRWIQQPKHIPIARQQLVKLMKAAVTTAATRSAYDALIEVQQSKRDKLISLKKHMRVGMTTKVDIKGTTQSKSILDRLYHPVVRSKQEDQQPNITKPSNDSKKHIEPYLNKTFNEYVKKKISTFENELTKLKQTSYLRTRETNNEIEKVDDRNVTDNDSNFRADTREKHLQPSDLLRDYYDVIKEHIVVTNNGVTKESTTQYTPSSSNAAERTADKVDSDSNTNDTGKIVNESRFLTNAKTFLLDTKDLSKEFIRKETTLLDGPPEVATPTDDDADGTVSSSGAKEDDDQIIRHKNPYDHVNEMFASTKMFLNVAKE